MPRLGNHTGIPLGWWCNARARANMNEAATTMRGIRDDDCDNDATIARSRSPRRHGVTVVVILWKTWP